MALIDAFTFRRLRQVDRCEYKASLVCRVIPDQPKLHGENLHPNKMDNKILHKATGEGVDWHSHFRSKLEIFCQTRWKCGSG